jgi:hypothetical protein
MKKSYMIFLNIACGLIFFCALAHIAFWQSLNWKDTLACLDSHNRNIMYTFNVILILNFFAMIIISMFFRSELFSTKIGKFILVWFASFWFLRFILELILWSNSPSWVVIGLCLFLGITYIFPILFRNKI